MVVRGTDRGRLAGGDDRGDGLSGKSDGAVDDLAARVTAASNPRAIVISEEPRKPGRPLPVRARAGGVPGKGAGEVGMDRPCMPRGWGNRGGAARRKKPTGHRRSLHRVAGWMAPQPANQSGIAGGGEPPTTGLGRRRASRPRPGRRDRRGRPRGLDGGDPEEPELLEGPAGDEDGGAGAACGIDRQVGHRDADQVDQGEPESDGDRGESLEPGWSSLRG